MQEPYDKIICRGLSYECEIGFHGLEKGIRQRLLIDFEASVDPPEQGKLSDRIQSIKLDYFEANQLISKLVENHKFNLLETVADRIANLLLDRFDTHAVWVSVTKHPIDMPNAQSVSYTCCRKQTP